MLRETEYTRAIRRAQHDGYAPFTVRPAIRGARPMFDRLEVGIAWLFRITVAVLAVRVLVAVVFGR